MKETRSIIGETLTPDFSKEEDLGDALYNHMMFLSPVLRSAVTISDPETPGANTEDLHDLLELLAEGFEAGTREFDSQRTHRPHGKIQAVEEA
jgi:hypothetical protein